MKKTLLTIALIGGALSASSQEIEVNTLKKGLKVQTLKGIQKLNKEKAGVVGNCENDTVRYVDNKAAYLDPSYWNNIARVSQQYRVFTTAYNVPAGSSVKILGAEVTAQVRRYNSGTQTSTALLSDTVVNAKVYIFNVDADNKPVFEANGKALDSASIQIHAAVKKYYATFTIPVTVTSNYAIGFRAFSTAPNDFVYITQNFMDVSTATGNSPITNDPVVPYGEKLSYSYTKVGTDFVFLNMEEFYGPGFDFEYYLVPIVSHEFTADFNNFTPCSVNTNRLTNTSVNTGAFESATYNLMQFAKKYDISEDPTSNYYIPRDSVYFWSNKSGDEMQTNSKAVPFTYTVPSSLTTHSDTLGVFYVSHGFYGCFTEKINTYQILNCAGLDEVKENSFSIFPNPTSDLVTISLGDNNQNGTIVLTSADGKVIETRNFSNASVQSFDVKGLTSGVYFFQVGNETQKVMIK